MSSPLLALPEDVWTHLLQFCPLSTAVILALTCRGLQHYADRIIYRSIDIAAFPEAIVDRSSEVSPAPQPGEYGSEFGLMANGWTNALRHKRSSTDVLATIHSSLIYHPERVAYVRNLALVLSHRNWQEFVGVFRLLQANLVELGIRPTQFARNGCLDTEGELGATIVREICGIHLKRLTRLAMPVEAAVRPFALALLRAAGGLRTLEILPEAYSPHKAREPWSLPHMPCLESVSVADITPQVAIDLIRLIEDTPTLRDVRLANEAPGRYLRIPDAEKIVRALAKHPGLERLAIDEAFKPIWDGFRQLRELDIRIIRDRCWARALHDIEIPPLPSLETLTFTTYDPYAWHAESFLMSPCRHEESAPVTPSAIGPPAHLIDLLELAPRLHSIRQRVDTGPVTFDYRAEPSSKIEESVAIRTYADGDRFFVHIRTTSHQVVHEGQVQHHRDKFVQDYSDYAGRHLSTDELRELYERAELDFDWECGTRNLVLTTDAWEYLQALSDGEDQSFE